MIQIIDVEPIMEALLARLQDVSNIPTIKTVTRKWQPWDQLAQLNQPAIVIVEPEEKEEHRRGQQSKITLEVQLIVYVRGNNSATDTEAPPVTGLNNVIKGIRTALKPSGSDIGQNVNTLGGLVSDCYINGKIKKDAGVLDEQMSAIVPITITVP